MLELLPPRDRATLARIVTRLLVVHAAGHGIDLFAGTRDAPGTRGPSRPRLSPSLAHFAPAVEEVFTREPAFR
jgi:hypothetical protein